VGETPVGLSFWRDRPDLKVSTGFAAWQNAGMTAKLPPSLAALRALAPRLRRIGRTSDAAPLLARLISTCTTVAVEPRTGGLAFRLAGRERDVDFTLTCVLHDAPTPLSEAEADVARSLCEGRTLAQIARLRGVTVNTIKSQVRQLFRKLDVDSRVALVRKLCP
jgi:DNA-binding CsgD family transcriptional regulator